MIGHLSAPLEHLSRREFLYLAGAAAAALFLPDASTAAAQSTSPQLGRITAHNTPLFDKPSFSAKQYKSLIIDSILPITATTIGDGEPAHNRIWYELNHEGFVHSGSVQPVELNINPIMDVIPYEFSLVEVSVPYTDVIYNVRSPKKTAYRFYYSSTHWVDKVVQDDLGKAWYRVRDDKWGTYHYADPTHLHLINPEELAPISPDIPIDSKRLEVRVNEQLVIAYEGDVPVFMTRAATGAKFRHGDYRTPIGRFITNRKRPSRHMADGSLVAPGTYDLPGVPWVCYLNERGVAFHGTYWHNDFGKPRSHGCINVPSSAAKWIYRWCSPAVPFSEHSWDEETGTVVNVI
jgi:hypothetical protein